jgi:hypothetical protein
MGVGLMSEDQKASRLRQIAIGLALLTGILVGIAACGEDGEPQPTPPGVGGGPDTTPGVATTPPAITTASPVATVVALTPTASVPATTVVGFDMDASGNSATALGSPDRCVSVSAENEEEFEVDVFLDGLSKDSVLGFGYDINFPDGVVRLVDHDHSMLVEAEPGSASTDLSDDPPSTASPHFVTVADFGPAEYNPPYTQGVLGRYTFKVLPTAEPGTYSLTLTRMDIARDTLADPDYPGYPLGGAIPIVAIWDGTFEPSYGMIAVDVSCDTARATST